MYHVSLPLFFLVMHEVPHRHCCVTQHHMGSLVQISSLQLFPSVEGKATDAPLWCSCEERPFVSSLPIDSNNTYQAE